MPTYTHDDLLLQTLQPRNNRGASGCGRWGVDGKYSKQFSLGNNSKTLDTEDGRQGLEGQTLPAPVAMNVLMKLNASEISVFCKNEPKLENRKK